MTLERSKTSTAGTANCASANTRTPENSHAVLRELVELLEEYAPTWYTEEHHDRAAAALGDSSVQSSPKTIFCRNTVPRHAMKTHFPTVPVEVARKNATDALQNDPPLVLVVDDEPLITETLAAILSHSGYAAVTAPDGLAALEIVRLMPPQMLITDVAMPGMNGFDLAIEVKRMVPECQILLFSGQASTSELAAEYSASGHEFATLVKPVHPRDLLARVSDCLGKPRSPIVGKASNGANSSLFSDNVV
jgi:CheY-like chemotaxis protein